MLLSSETETAGPSGSKPADPFLWRTSYGEALAAAKLHRTPLLVYFPPVGQPDSPTISLAERALGSPPRAQGVRVGADDVVELMERFGVEDVPCLLLVDRTEKVVARWSRAIPRTVWRLVDSGIRVLERRDIECRRVVDGAETVLESGDAESAFRRVASLLDADGIPDDVVEEARSVERRLQEQVRQRVLAVLAAERLLEDSWLVERLDAIRRGTQHTGLREEIQAEIARLKTGTIVGKSSQPGSLRLRPANEDERSSPAPR